VTIFEWFVVQFYRWRLARQLARVSAVQTSEHDVRGMIARAVERVRNDRC
jgi:hypothetical protein